MNIFLEAKTRVANSLTAVLDSFANLEYGSYAGAQTSIRRYFGLLGAMVPLHVIMTFVFSYKAKGAGMPLASGLAALSTLHSIMIVPAILFLVGCWYAVKNSKFEHALAMAITATYMCFNAILTLVELKSGAGSAGGGALLIYSVILSVIYLAPPYVTFPLYVTCLTGAATIFYVTDNTVFQRSPFLLVNMAIVTPLILVLSSMSWRVFYNKVIAERDLQATKVLLASRQAELDKLVEIDTLTGLYNRRRFCEITNRDFAKASRQAHGNTGCILVIDVDKLQNINTEYGFAVGDKVISRIARTIRRPLRATDVIGRIGGDVFSVFLPETTRAGAVQVAEKIRADVESYVIVVPASSTHGRVELKATVSIGIASWYASPRAAKIEPDDLNALAMLAMKNAKNAGRNKIMIA